MPTEHTQGDWEFVRTPMSEWRLVGSTPFGSFSYSHQTILQIDIAAHAPTVADLTLICAAPDLLAALENCIRTREMWTADDAAIWKAAIAKAKGEDV